MTDEDALRAAVERRAQALASGRASALEAVLHPRFRWTSHRGEVFDRAAYVRSNTAGDLVWRQQLVDRTEVVVLGDTGLVTCVVTDQVEVDGASRSFRMPVTQTWVREAGEWRCLAGHAGPLL
ncbi:nuclear transport factor 2 family protein [Cryptosporangium aurantiacum]|uniref:nuclear transport factor 2 family protein n=1 Tax=Cryptosporangium aurantiacum TaxID=134849 RepID=UPI0015BCF25C|nr:nuclear transport factor 2 family protein [Cryptosporangium aurantiacum]